MAVSSGYIDFVKDLFAPFGEISVRKMFGGAGVYCDGRMFAIIGDDDLWLKADDDSRGEFEAAGLQMFTYETKAGDAHAMSYFAPPDEVFDDEDELRRWTGLALEAAARRAANAVSKAKKTAVKKREAVSPSRKGSTKKRAAKKTVKKK
ncbi:MAG: TfoX/Sxy family protein [Pseudomonadota bacterium]